MKSGPVAGPMEDPHFTELDAHQERARRDLARRVPYVRDPDELWLAEKRKRFEAAFSERAARRAYPNFYAAEDAEGRAAIARAHAAKTALRGDPDFHPEQPPHRAMMRYLLGTPELQTPPAPAVLPASSSTYRPKARRGGRDTYLLHKPAMNLLEAAHFAAWRSLHLSNELTIVFKHLGLVDDEEVKASFEHFLGCFSKWFYDNGEPRAYLYVWERGLEVGLHVHMAFHLRKGRQSRFAQWVRDHLDKERPRIGSREGVQQPFISFHAPTDIARQRYWLRYLLKGLDQTFGFDVEGVGRVAFGEAMGLDLVQQGEVPFKRSGVSEALGEIARKKWKLAPGLRWPKDWRQWPMFLWNSEEAGSLLRPVTNR